MVKTFIDLDGVQANWEKKAIELMELNEEEVIPKLKAGQDIEDIVGGDIWGKLDSTCDNFWTKLDLLPWAYDLVDTALKYGEVAFLSSGGNNYKRAYEVGEANKGKGIWTSIHFQDYKIPLILARNKEFCASNDSILVDDRITNIKRFEQYGGHGFHWPNAYKILQGDLDSKVVLGELEDKIISIDRRAA